MANLKFGGRFGGPEELISSVQTLTDSWANLGDELDIRGARLIGLWPTVVVNDSLNIQARLLVRHTAAGTDYVFPAKSLMLAQEKDEILIWELGCMVAFGQFQVRAGTVGSTAGTVQTAHATVGA